MRRSVRFSCGVFGGGSGTASGGAGCDVVRPTARAATAGLIGIMLIVGASGCGSSHSTSSGDNGRSSSSVPPKSGEETASTGSAGSSSDSSPTASQGPVATNLRVPADVRARLRVTLATVRESKLLRERLGQAEKGTVYYAAFNGGHYAMATFDIPGRGTADQPSIFARYGSEDWVYAGDRPGDVAAQAFLPCAVRRAWATAGCTVPPAAVASHRAFIHTASQACDGIGQQIGQAASFAGIAAITDSQLQGARAMVGRVAAMQLAGGDRTVANQLLTLEARLIGLASYGAEAYRAHNLQGRTNSVLGFGKAARDLGALASAHGINHCGTG